MAPAATSNGDDTKQAIGVYTKTSVQSSVVRFIIHARIRHRKLNDVVFVGDNYIHVKHVGHRGHLSHVAFKNNFDSPIRHAGSFRLEQAPEDEDFLVKLENEKEAAFLNPCVFPPQSIVLTLEFDLVFIFLQSTASGEYGFVQQVVPMVKFDRKIYQPGHYLAVDPQSRALAVSAQEREIVIYAAKAQEQIQDELRNRERDWCPVSSERRLAIEGVVQHVSFLVPPDDDTDHIILLAIVVDQGLMKAIRIDWSHSAGPRSAQIYPGQALDTATSIPSLLVPLQDASFLLITGIRLTLWKNILSGSTTGTSLEPVDEVSQYPGNSGALPVWASWAKPQRSQTARAARDDIYLVREDGLVLYMTIPKAMSTQVNQSIAGSLGCHAGTAFASLGGEGDPDVLCVAGDTSSGIVVSIGNWPSARRMREMSRVDTMGIKPIELLPNWASITDTVPAELVHTTRSRSKDNDSLFVTSGRQPYGAITELRQGVEGIAATFMTSDFLRAVTDVWTLPDLTTGFLIVVLSSPLGTVVWRLNADFATPPEDVGGTSAFDTEQRTLAAAFTCGNVLIQVTPKSICASQALHANFEDTSRLNLAENEEILAASIVLTTSKVVVAVQRGNSFMILSYDASAADDITITDGHRIELPCQPLCVASTAVETGTLVLTSTSDGRLFMIHFDDSGTTPICFDVTLPTFADQAAPCDHISILESDNVLVAACGLRSGSLVSYVVTPDATEPIKHIDTKVIGSSTIRLTTIVSDKTSAIAMTGESTLLLKWSGENTSLGVDNIWITDKAEPGYAQGSVVAACQMPDAHYLSSDAVAGKMLLLSDDELIVVGLDDRRSTVPRQLSTSGTPNRMVYAESIRHLVCSGLRYDVRVLPSRPQAPPEEKRQLWPVVDFIAVKYTRPMDGEPTSYTRHTHEMQPGDKINALLSWSMRLSGEKTYAWVLAGGSYLRKNGTRRGKVTFLRPKIKKWEVYEVTVSKEEMFDQEVTALAVYDDTTYVICAGNKVYLYQLDVGEMKWEPRCPALTLASAGVYMTVEGSAEDCRQIVITTAADSIVILCLKEGEGDAHLQQVCAAPRADYLISHHYLPNADDKSTTVAPMVLTGDKAGRIIGMSTPTADKIASSARRNHSALLQFEARLPYSLTRLRPSAAITRKGERPPGLASNRILGSATDGTVIALATIDEHTWRKLFWLQRLIEWNEVLSPYSYADPVYVPGGNAMLGDVRAVPIGLKGEDKTMLQVASTHHSRLNDMHINGDVLARVLQKGGAEAVRSSMKAFAQEKVSIGSWLAKNIEDELEALDEVVALVRKFDAWL